MCLYTFLSHISTLGIRSSGLIFVIVIALYSLPATLIFPTSLRSTLERWSVVFGASEMSSEPHGAKAVVVIQTVASVVVARSVAMNVFLAGCCFLIQVILCSDVVADVSVRLEHVFGDEEVGPQWRVVSLSVPILGQQPCQLAYISLCSLIRHTFHSLSLHRRSRPFLCCRTGLWTRISATPSRDPVRTLAKLECPVVIQVLSLQK